MNAIVWTKGNGLSLRRDYPKPTAPPEGYVVLDVQYVGLRNIDHLTAHESDFPNDYCVVPGHEISATVARAGAGVDLAVGTPVVVYPYMPCDECRRCKSGWGNCGLRVIGIHQDGGLCEQIMVPVENAYPVRGIDPRTAVLVDVFAVAENAVGSVEFDEEPRVLVIGSSTRGLAIALVLRAKGYTPHLLDQHDAAIDIAVEKFGFTEATAKFSTWLECSSKDDQYDVIFDTTQYDTSLPHAFNNLLAPRGTVVSVGPTKEKIDFSPYYPRTAPKKLIFSGNPTRAEFENALDFVTREQDPVTNMVTFVTPLEHALERIIATDDGYYHGLKDVAKVKPTYK